MDLPLDYPLALTLRNINIRTHYEKWYITVDNTIFAYFNTPLNNPQKGTHIMSPFQAMRQFCLMTSIEGWKIEGSSILWHQFVEQQKEPKCA